MTRDQLHAKVDRLACYVPEDKLDEAVGIVLEQIAMAYGKRAYNVLLRITGTKSGPGKVKWGLGEQDV